MFELELSPSDKQLRQFGVIAFVAFGFAGAWLLRTGALFGWNFGGFASAVSYGFVLIGVLSAVSALLWPRANRPLFVLLTVVTFPIGLVVSHMVMLVLFFVIITPIGLLFRVIGRDPLERRWDEHRNSYWEDVRETSDPKEYFRQF